MTDNGRPGRREAACGHGTLSLFDDCVSNLTPSSPRNSIPCSSKTRRIVSRVRARIGGVPLTCSPREIADSETPLWSDNLRIDHFSNARAAWVCAPLMGSVELPSDLLSGTRFDPRMQIAVDVSQCVSFLKRTMFNVRKCTSKGVASGRAARFPQ